jgi:hypothetical protein
MSKKREIYGETYNKGIIATNRDQIIKYIKASEFIFLNKQSKYDDGTQSLTITIEIKSDIAEKLKNE